MRVVQRRRVELDICPQCRGVALDRGELEKIIEQGSAGDHHRDERLHQHDNERSSWQRDDDDWRDKDNHKRQGQKRRPSIFDIFG